MSKALKNVAFQDEGLIQYKAEVMLRIFEEKIKPLIDGRAKAMIVTSSRLAGLRYFQIETTQRLRQAGEIMGITVLDHIIFNSTEYFSFLESDIGF